MQHGQEFETGKRQRKLVEGNGNMAKVGYYVNEKKETGRRN